MKLRKLKLTEKDKLTLVKYINICTDLHGNGCSIKDLGKETNKLILNQVVPKNGIVKDACYL